MITANIPSNTASAITPFNPLGKVTVGEEEKDSKNSSFKAVEESSQSSRTNLQDDDVNQKVESVLDKGDDKQNESELEQERSAKNAEQEQQLEQENKQAQRLQAEQQEEIRKLAYRDREVCDHEHAHAAVGGQFAGAPNYQYKRGPDGINYAVAGEVSISTGTVNNDPQATITKAQQIRRAALAPADPSPQDRRVAATATQMEAEARQALADLQRREQQVLAEEKQLEGETRRQEAQTLEESRDIADNDSLAANADNRDLVTNRRIIAINEQYLALIDQSVRLGSIVSEAV